MLPRILPSAKSAPLFRYARGYATKAGLKDVVIVSTARTPIGSFGGALSSISGVKLQAMTIKEALARAGVKAEEVTEAIIGNVISANLGQAPARQAALLAGLSQNTVCTTINKVCSSGMKSIIYGAQSIQLGLHDVVIAGGFESMSNVPYYLDKARTGYRMGNQSVVDGIMKDGLSDAFDNQPMGICAEDCSKRHGISRKEQDDYAILSYKRAAEATQKGYFKAEIMDVSVPSAKGEPTIVKEDEEIKKAVFDKIPSLKPAFVKEGGTVTVANSSKINDGACAVLLMSAEKAQALGLKPIARIVGYGDAEHAPIEFPTAPSKAIPKALQNAGLQISDIDYFEVNEAFAVVALANQKLLGLKPDRLNVHGGGVGLGHPIGMSGARITASLAHILRQYNGKYGVASICNGGGGASAIVLEKL